ncbi:MAG: DUF1523 family protein [Cereibacter changlensis]|uniref:DUF1523 domain-containing protein n=2 Tax=Cereibacter changlensis TaxID=402884 RepID=A0A2T4JYU4_9RHOB|nr:DUF1523 family protein [Cereibacter changlensis]PTE23092.1 DUF1523 domain-containing protein [Cereibacter changlensis JA139]PZX50876.1 uncharacterized protein DUF1523 [Cereibacter changlensis]
MRYVKWTALALLVLFVASFLHYTLPQHDVVRIVGTNTQRMDLGENTWFFSAPDTGNATTIDGNRDVKFIEAIYPNGKPMVYRNEDTGWGWPPYFKVNSFDIQAQATDLTSTEAAPKWVLVTHYGWRSQLFTIFPNAVRLKQVEGPDVTVIPWFNIFFFLMVAGIVFMAVKMWMQFRERTIDPALDDMGEAWDGVEARAVAARKGARTNVGRFRAWLRGLGQ